MTLKQYFITLGIGVCLTFLSFILIILRINPENNRVLGPLLFYISFFLTVAGLYAIAGFAWRVYILKQSDVIFRQVKKTFRQGCLFAAFGASALILQHARFLRWWNILILIACALFIELRSLKKEEPKTI